MVRRMAQNIFWEKAGSLERETEEIVDNDYNTLSDQTDSENEYEYGDDIIEGMVNKKPDGKSYVVLKILGVKMKRARAVQFFLRWEGDHWPSWTHASNMDCPRLVSKFEKRLKKSTVWKNYIAKLERFPKEIFHIRFLGKMRRMERLIAKGKLTEESKGSKQKMQGKGKRKSKPSKNVKALKQRSKVRPLVIPECEMAALSLSPEPEAAKQREPSPPAPSVESVGTSSCEDKTADLSDDTACVLAWAKPKESTPQKSTPQKSITQKKENCRLPSSWKGKWFQSGVQQSIEIKIKSMETKGNCYESSGDKFLFLEPENNCHRCIVINERHPNVLQYKESVFCEDKDSLESLCSKIPGDAQLYSLFRLDATPQECPFTGAPFTFTYNRGYGECKSPVSHVDTCTENSHLLLRYQACPDVLKTESTVEELQCMGQWREGSQQYLVGRIHHRLSASFEDTYRCFVFEKIKGHGQHGGVTGYKLAMSGDATCTGVSSPTEGARTLTFTKAETSAAKCRFPVWFSSHKWHTLDGKLSIRTSHKNTTFHITDDSRSNVSGQNSLFSKDGGNRMALFLASGSRVTCQSFKEFSERHVALLTHHVVGCKSQSVCIHMYKRDRHVIELQMREVSEGEEGFVCNNSKAMSTGMPFVTLVNAESVHRRCPYLGKYSATGVTQDGRVVRDACGPSLGQAANFQTLVVGCGDHATMEFHSSCPNQEESTAFACHGSWEEGGTGFLIASPLSRSSTTARRYCFIYTSEPEGNLRVSSSSESCKRNPGVEGLWAFNLTVEGQCAEAVRAGSAPSPTLVVIPMLLLTASLLLSTSSLVKSLIRAALYPQHSVLIQR